MIDRDPRVDPRPGDVLSGFSDEDAVRVLDVQGEMVLSTDGPFGLNVWRKVMKNAEVIHVSD